MMVAFIWAFFACCFFLLGMWLENKDWRGCARWANNAGVASVLLAALFGFLVDGDRARVIGLPLFLVFIILVNLVKNWLDSGSGVQGAAADVRQDAALTAALAKPFDPAKYIDIRKGIFVGLDAGRKPVFMPRLLIDKNHIEILGESGVGKSSLAGVMLAQLAAAGETVVVFDPKNDRNLPGALSRAGKTWGKFDVNVIDLRPQIDFAQVNPFQNCRADQVEELLSARV